MQVLKLDSRLEVGEGGFQVSFNSQYTFDNFVASDISDLINPGVTIVIPISEPSSTLNVSKMDIRAALLACSHHRFTNESIKKKSGSRAFQLRKFLTL